MFYVNIGIQASSLSFSQKALGYKILFLPSPYLVLLSPLLISFMASYLLLVAPSSPHAEQACMWAPNESAPHQGAVRKKSAPL